MDTCLSPDLSPGIIIPLTYSFPLIIDRELPREFRCSKAYSELTESLYTLSFDYFIPLYN